MKKIAVSVLICCILLLICSTVFAQPNINFTATNSYWVEPGKLAVEGYFYNNGTKTITGITYFELTIYYYNQYEGKYLWLGKGSWSNNYDLLNVYLYPGETSNWTFYINTPTYPGFEHWRYEWYAKYNFQY